MQSRFAKDARAGYLLFSLISFLTKWVAETKLKFCAGGQFIQPVPAVHPIAVFV